MAVTANPYTEKGNQIREYAEQLGDIVASPGFLGIVDEMESATPEERFAVVNNVASVEEFRRRDIPTPDGLRVSPRVFEDPTAAWQSEEYQPFELQGIQAQPMPQAGTCVSFGVYLCASYGN
jgi:hypothetical protein